MLLGLFAIVSFCVGIYLIGYFIYWIFSGMHKKPRQLAEQHCNNLIKLIDEMSSNQKVVGAATAMNAKIDAAKAQALTEETWRKIREELEIIKKKLKKAYLLS
jgi:hypothetical protein